MLGSLIKLCKFVILQSVAVGVFMYINYVHMMWIETPEKAFVWDEKAFLTMFGTSALVALVPIFFGATCIFLLEQFLKGRHFFAVSTVVGALTGMFVIIFNGRAAGATRIHYTEVLRLLQHETYALPFIFSALLWLFLSRKYLLHPEAS